MTPPSAPVQKGDGSALTEVLALEERRPGRPHVSDDQGLPPIRTSRNALTGDAVMLPAPSPAEVRAARIAAGHTQMQAAAAIGARRSATWSDYEGGITPMPALSWTWYLLATGMHPEALLARRR